MYFFLIIQFNLSQRSGCTKLSEERNGKKYRIFANLGTDRSKFISAHSLIEQRYRVSQKHGNSVTNSISSLLWISIVIPNFKSHNIIMSARVYMKRVKDCKDVSIMSPQDEQWVRTSLLCLYTVIFLLQSKHKQTKCKHSRRNSYRLQLSQ